MGQEGKLKAEEIPAEQAEQPQGAHLALTPGSAPSGMRRGAWSSEGGAGPSTVCGDHGTQPPGRRGEIRS